MKKQDKMMRAPAREEQKVEVQGVEVVCVSDCVLPGRGEFKHGAQFTVTPKTAGELLSSPCFKRLKEVE